MKKIALLLIVLVSGVMRVLAQADGSSVPSALASDYRIPKTWEPRFGMGISISTIVTALPATAQRQEWRFKAMVRLSPRWTLENGIITIYHSDEANKIYFRRINDEFKFRYQWYQIKKADALLRVYSSLGVRWQGDFYPDEPWWNQIVPWDNQFWFTPTLIGAEIIFVHCIGVTVEANSSGKKGTGDFYPSVGVNFYLNRK